MVLATPTNVFFTHIASVLDTTISDTLLSYSNLVIGSDEEKALVKAIKDSFPTSELTLCTRHLSENVTRHLRTKNGKNQLDFNCPSSGPSIEEMETFEDSDSDDNDAESDHDKSDVDENDLSISDLAIRTRTRSGRNIIPRIRLDL
ncbi:Hypothetical predicted protein [Mytilus galloprovincialis]|uniref:MULE transposase domain-containing protein n=1 Tax=Mytilus galloprovincialis TaxID=29158 RepID=A0A8B6G6R6_MYTGA|nr:Hypothetical predicted protein [Mytilus galloprovincialis]